MQKLLLMRVIFLVFFLLFTTTLKSQTQIELNFKWCDKYKEADKELNLVYQNILNEYSKDTLFIKNLKDTQNNWIKLKESDMELYMPTLDDWGSSRAMCRCQFLIDLTKERTKFLRKWADAGERDGWMCGGTFYRFQE